jgi:hypothetical protein
MPQVKSPKRKVEVIAGKKYVYPCKKCKVHTIDCFSQAMLDAISRELYGKEK